VAQSNCEIKDCQFEAKYITSAEGRYLKICEQHWHEKYKN
jgi:hypothetical protein